MAKRKRSFINGLLASTFVPLISFWLLFACYIIFAGVNDETGSVQGNLDFYVSLIAIIGGPALLGINSILKAWEAETQATHAALPSKFEAELAIAHALQAHTLEMQKSQKAHEHELELRHQAHQFDLEAHKAKTGSKGK